MPKGAAVAELTFEQRRAVENPRRGTVLLAGAGSGKTTVLVERYLRTVAAGVRPSEILTVTFTNAAAAEMRERIARRLHDSDPKLALRVESTPLMGTLHSICFHLLRSYGEELGAPVPEKLMADTDTARLFEKEFQRLLRRTAPESLRTLLKHYSLRELPLLFWEAYAKRYLFPEETAASLAAVPFGNEFHAVFSQLKAAMAEKTVRAGRFGFDDLEHETLSLLRRLTKPLLEVKAVLVDEFQDLSPAQWEIVQRLVQGDANRLFLVGDPKQSIYGFRGAEVRLFQRGVRAVLDAGGETVDLTCNFRSGAGVVDYLNQLSPRLFDGSEVPSQIMESGRGPGGEHAVSVLPFEDDEETLLAEAISREVTNGVRPADMAVLFRASIRIPAFLEALKVRGIPARTTQSVPAERFPSIVDTLSYFRFIKDPHDDLHCAAFLRSSYVAISEKGLEDLAALSGDSLFLKWVGHRATARWILPVLESGTVKTGDLLEQLFAHSLYWPSDAAFASWLATLSPEAAVDDLVEGWDALRRLGLTPRFPPETQDTNSVVLTTVHAAKGLEWKSVYLVDLERTSPPSVPPIRVDPNGLGFRFREKDEKIVSPEYERLTGQAKAREGEESKRLLYVALTRARDRLTLIVPETVKGKNSWAQFLKSAGAVAMPQVVGLARKPATQVSP